LPRTRLTVVGHIDPEVERTGCLTWSYLSSLVD
jgi:hypothetical protein